MDEPARAERWGISEDDLTEAEAPCDDRYCDQSAHGFLLEEDQPWRAGGEVPGG